jgi:hypothetical protein
MAKGKATMNMICNATLRGKAQTATPLGYRLVRNLRAAMLAVGLCCAGLAFASPASAQAPKAFTYYEDSADLGFKIKIPKDWEFIPPQPGDKNLIGKYDPKQEGKGILLKSGKYWGYHVWLIKFDRRKSASDGAGKRDETRIEMPGLKNVEAYLKGGDVGLPGSLVFLIWHDLNVSWPLLI